MSVPFILDRTLISAAPAFWQRYTRELKRAVKPAPFRPNPLAWPDHGLHAAWLGHSTVLLKIDGFTILTDPVFSDRAGIDLLITTLGIKRLVAPALPIAAIPKPDLILLSHAHMDHFDLPSLRRLRSKHTAVVTATRTSDLLKTRAYQSVTELAWNETCRIGPARIRAIEVNHWGARMRSDTYRGYNGYLIETGRYSVLFAGDTANTPTFTRIAGSREIDLALMPIGAYDPWIRAHCTPEQSWRMSQEANARHVLPIHHSTFRLSREPLTEPIERLQEAAGGDATSRIVITQIGQEWSRFS